MGFVVQTLEEPAFHLRWSICSFQKVLLKQYLKNRVLTIYQEITNLYW